MLTTSLIFAAHMTLGYLAWCAGYREWRIPPVPSVMVTVAAVVNTILWTTNLKG